MSKVAEADAQKSPASPSWFKSHWPA